MEFISCCVDEDYLCHPVQSILDQLQRKEAVINKSIIIKFCECMDLLKNSADKKGKGICRDIYEKAKNSFAMCCMSRVLHLKSCGDVIGSIHLSQTILKYCGVEAGDSKALEGMWEEYCQQSIVFLQRNGVSMEELRTQYKYGGRIHLCYPENGSINQYVKEIGKVVGSKKTSGV